MFESIIRKYDEIVLKEYLNKDFLLAIELLSILTYLDKEIKHIEIYSSNKLIEAWINENIETILLKKKLRLINFANNIYIENLKKYKKDGRFYITRKNALISKILHTKDKRFVKSIFKINLISNLLNSDGLISREEHEFILKIREKSHE
jgi:hypothetical protein